MHRWVVIGLLRDGVARSEDEVARAYGERTGMAADRATLAAEIAGLAAEGVIVATAAEPSGEPAYRLGAEGTAAFDAWLTAPAALDGPDDERITSRLLMLGEVSPVEGARLLGRWERELWERARALEEARATATAAVNGDDDAIAVRPALLERLLEHVAADLATLAELRSTWDAWRAPSRTA